MTTKFKEGSTRGEIVDLIVGKRMKGLGLKKELDRVEERVDEESTSRPDFFTLPFCTYCKY